MMHRIVSTTLFVFAIFAFATPVTAESQAEFKDRIAVAYHAEDKEAALRQLFYLEGVDEEIFHQRIEPPERTIRFER